MSARRPTSWCSDSESSEPDVTDQASACETFQWSPICQPDTGFGPMNPVDTTPTAAIMNPQIWCLSSRMRNGPPDGNPSECSSPPRSAR